jgi:hypothetical protein
VTVLGNPSLADIEFRQHFDPDDEVLVQPLGNFEGLSQYPIDSASNPRRGTSRLNVHVTRINRSGLFENHFLNSDNRRRLSAGSDSFVARNYSRKL